MAVTDSTAATAQLMGQQLRLARERAGWGVDAVAAQLKMQKSLICALEEGDWSRLGAPVFVRGHLRSYARLVRIELDGLDAMTTAPVAVTPMVRSGRGRQMFGRLGTRLVYVVITALIGVPVWIAAQRHLAVPDKTLAVALDIPEVQPVSAAPLPVPLPEHEPLPASGGQSTDAPVPVSSAASGTPPPLTAMASLLPSPLPEPAPLSDITLHVNQDSWVELYAPGGGSLEQSLINAGEVRRFAHGQLGRVVIGNVDGVTLRIGGEVRDLSGVRRANVARFAVSSDGSIRPVSD